MELNEYWALGPIEEIAQNIEDKFSEYQQWLYRSGYASRIKLCYDRYYGIGTEGSLALEKSEDGKLTNININHYKNLLKRLHILVTQNKLSFQPRSLRNDSSALIDADLGRGLLEYYSDDKDMHSVFSEAVETALVCLEAYIHAPWDANEGQEVATDGSKLIFEGDQAFNVLTALDVGKSTSPNSNWYIVREKKNKYDLAAQFPQFETEILNSKLEKSYQDEIMLDPTLHSYGDEIEDDEAVYVFTLYHKRTQAIRTGRQTVICANQVLEDGPLQYKDIPLFNLKAGNILQTTMADSPGIDLLPLQEAINLLSSAVLTNNLNNAVQNIWSQDPNITIKKVSKSQNLIVSSIPPQGINFTQSSGETYKLLDQLTANQQLLSGINETTRGNPQASLKSGNSLALMLAQAIQFVSELQKGYAQLAGDVGSCVINNLKQFAQTERIAYLVGSNRKTYAKTFKSDDLMGIDRIAVDLGNPILQSQAGRWELVQMMTQYGLVQDPKLIASFLRTGEMDQTTDDEFKDHILIKQENEMLLKGETPQVILTDIHPEHIAKHKSVFDDPEVRANPEIMNAALQHIQAHIDQMRSIDPILAQMLGMQPLPPEQPPAPESQDQIPEVNPGKQMDEGVNLPTVPDNAPPEVKQAYMQFLNSNK